MCCEMHLIISDNGRTTYYPEEKRRELIQKYFDGMCECDGSEALRYSRIYADLVKGRSYCSDEC